MTNQNKNREFDDFDEFADEYESIHNSNIRLSGAKSDELNKERIKMVRDYESSDSLKILDFGCGPGSSEQFLSEYFPTASIVGIDPSLQSIEVAKKRNIPKCEFKVFDGKKWPEKDGTVDVIIMANVLHHISFDQHESVMKEARRTLKKGGRLYIFEHNPLNPLTLHFVNTCSFDHDAILLRASYAHKLLVHTGFSEIRNKFFIFLPRFKFLKPFVRLEKLLFWLPFGGKYYVRAINN